MYKGIFQLLSHSETVILYRELRISVLAQRWVLSVAGRCLRETSLLCSFSWSEEVLMEWQKCTSGPTLFTGCGCHLSEAQVSLQHSEPVLKRHLYYFKKYLEASPSQQKRMSFYSGVRRFSAHKLFAFSLPLAKKL